MGRVVGIDFGEARVGFALSDTGRMLASPIKSLQGKKNLKEVAASIVAELTAHDQIEKIVIGLPLHLNGKESPSSLRVRELKKHMEELTDHPIILWDERLTTAQVERTLKEANMGRKKRTKVVDAMAAAAILQNYLDQA